MSTINERIKFIISEFYNDNNSEFERALELKKDSIKHVISGRSKPSYDTIQSIMRTNVQIDARWLICGDCEMIKCDNSIIEELKTKLNRLEGENNILREQAGLGVRKEGKSA